jgi:Lrp/AsnC family transcriptional regulator for asnA, asnC and gidA
MLDGLDQRLLMELLKNGRRSWVSLARQLGVAEGTVRKRVNALLKENIMKAVAVVNLSKLGYELVSIVALQVRMSDLEDVAQSMIRKPNVCYLAFVAGRYDLIAMVVTRSPEELAQFIASEISAIPGILRTETFVNLRVIKGAYPEVDTAGLISKWEVVSQPRTGTDKDAPPRQQSQKRLFKK